MWKKPLDWAKQRWLFSHLLYILYDKNMERQEIISRCKTCKNSLKISAIRGCSRSFSVLIQV
ncbi:hypothetical protein Hdeb2414_s0057g00757941 [Helianthus debilis subsp. tardiflorus]